MEKYEKIVPVKGKLDQDDDALGNEEKEKHDSFDFRPDSSWKDEQESMEEDNYKL